MQYSALAVANEFIDLAMNSGCHDLTPMKLQKLVYYAHGWHLALTGQPLISERIQAWQYGPVIPSLYRDLRGHGNQHIDHPEYTMRINTNSEEISLDDLIFETPRIKEDGSEEADFAKKLIKRIWEVYGKYTPARLSNATHVDGSPWKQVWKEGSTSLVIPNKIIEEYFKNLSRETAKA